jgi:hypothetical protein
MQNSITEALAWLAASLAWKKWELGTGTEQEEIMSSLNNDATGLSSTAQDRQWIPGTNLIPWDITRTSNDTVLRGLYAATGQSPARHHSMCDECGYTYGHGAGCSEIK